MAEFKLNADGTHYEHVIGFGGENTRASKSGTDVELFYLVEDEASSATSQGRQIYLSSHKKIEFSCSYSLATQTISTELGVTGTDIEISRAATGQLAFELIGSPNVNIGARYAFSIVPKTPGAVFYTPKNCKVETSDGLNSYGLIYDKVGSGQCTDDVTNVQLDSTGWSTSGQQDLSFTSFKFSSPGARGSSVAEAQMITCDIDLTMEFDADYNPATCVANVNECADNTHDCDVNASCDDTADGFTCSCNTGFTGDGETCVDIDECLLEIDDCDVNAVCSNTDGGFTCSCNTGYSGNGVTCTDDNECSDDVCDENGTCTNTDGSFDCSCNSGYVGDGFSCECQPGITLYNTEVAIE